MRIIDDKGRIFGKVNIIDFFVLLFLICLLPGGFFAYKIMTKEPVPIQYPSTYVITRPCPNCGNSIIIDTIEGEEKGIPKGEPKPEYYETTCSKCENEVVLLKNISTIPIPPNWESMLYKWLYENKELLINK